MCRCLSILVLLFGLLGGFPVQAEKQVFDFTPQEVEGLRSLAEKGDPQKQHVLGALYAEGDSVPQDNEKALDWFRKAAAQGYAAAQVSLGRFYFMGRGVKADKTEASQWFRKAAEQGDAEGQYFFGASLEFAWGVEENKLEAATWYQRAADQDLAAAQAALGLMYANGRGVKKDVPRALVLYRAAAEQGNAEAQIRLASHLLSGLGVPKDGVRGYQWVLIASASKQPDALKLLKNAEILATAAERREGERLARAFVPRKASEAARPLTTGPAPEATVPRVVEAAPLTPRIVAPTPPTKPAPGPAKAKEEKGFSPDFVAFIRARAEAGSAKAQCFFGLMHADGNGVPKDLTEARRWLEKAAEQQNARANYALGLMYSSGDGVPEDLPQAFVYFLKGALGGNRDAQYMVALMYAEGKGTRRGEDQSRQWAHEAAEQDHPDAQSYLGITYTQGRGVPKDHEEAVRWFRKAAAQGHVVGQRNMGLHLALGRGVPKNVTAAYQWLLLASRKGDPIAKKQIGPFEKGLTAAQRKEGKRLADAFVPKPIPPKSEFDDLFEDPVQGGIAKIDPVPAPPRLDPPKPAPGDDPKWKGSPEAKPPRGLGTGFFITEDGYFITNAHVASEGARVSVLTSGGAAASAHVVRVDKANDLSLLKIDLAGKYAFLPIAPSRAVRLGATVATVGFPNVGLQGSSPKLAKGEIASLAGIRDDARHFQMSVPIQPGNSGGALVDERGNVIGIVVSRLSHQAALATTGVLAENVNYAIKSGYLLSFLESVPLLGEKLKPPFTEDRKFEDVVGDAEKAAVMVVVE